MFGGKENPTVAFMDGWFHYFKLYAADIGCVGFMMIKYKWGLGKKDWFKWWPWFIVADPRAQGVVAMMSIVANVVCIAFIIQRSIKMGKNPYSNDVWAGTKDYEEAMARAEQEA